MSSYASMDALDSGESERNLKRRYVKGLVTGALAVAVLASVIAIIVATTGGGGGGSSHSDPAAGGGGSSGGGRADAVTGACCSRTPTPSCAVLPLHECHGNFVPGVTACEAGANGTCPAPPGRCCLSTGDCEVRTIGQCEAEGGLYDAATAGSPREHLCPADNPCRIDGDGRALPASTQYRIKGMMDQTVNPCDDFYRYACGTFIDENTALLSDSNPEVVASITPISWATRVEVMQVRAERYPEVDKLMGVCSNVSHNTLNVVRTLFEEIDRDVTDGEAATVLGKIGSLTARGYGFGALLEWKPVQNRAEPGRSDLALALDGTDPILWTDDLVQPAFAALQAAGLLANGTASRLAVAELEGKFVYTRMADQLDDDAWANGTVSTLLVGDVKKRYELDLEPFLNALKPSHAVNRVVLTEVDTWHTAAHALFHDEGSRPSPAAWRDYLKWRVVFGLLNFLPQPFVDTATEVGKRGSDSPYPWPNWPLRVLEPEHFEGRAARVPDQFVIPHMRRHARTGPGAAAAWGEAAARLQQALGSEEDPREYYCAALADGLFGTWFMHQYIVQDFPTYDRALADRLVNDTLVQMRRRVETLGWLDQETRDNALVKLDHLLPVVAGDPYADVGTPDVDWTKSPAEVFASLVAWRTAHMFSRADVEYNRALFQFQPWEVQPWTVNAFYNPAANTINLLPGLMLPPMFSPELPYSLNVASYLMVVGHEITHGYDNTGRKYGPLGKAENWWTNASLAEFEQRTQCLVDQYSDFSAFDGLFVNGTRTLGENIADGGGFDMSWQVYKAATPPPHPGMLQGFTNDQLHFIYQAQIWCTAITRDAYQAQLQDVHSPDQFRIRGPLSNFRPFAETWKCNKDQYYGRSLTDQACEVW